MKCFRYLSSLALIAGIVSYFPISAANPQGTAGNQTQNANQGQTQPQITTQQNNPQFQQDLKDSAAVSLAWLESIDNGQYDQSWDAGSPLFKQTISKSEWVMFLQSIRKPMGTLISRKVVDERTAKNPPGLPNGDYMVMVYKTSFTNNKDSDEVVTLMKGSDGQWRILTYQVK